LFDFLTRFCVSWDDSGANLLNYEEITKSTNDPNIFPTIMSAIIWAADKYGDLMRLSTACPGNDFRLGACEAPPAIFSMYLGDDLTKYLKFVMDTSPDVEIPPYAPNMTSIDLGAHALPFIDVPAEDRNRTSSFPYGGHRFEFRSVGSSQNVSIVNTVLCSITAYAFKHFADEIEFHGKKPRQVVKEALHNSWKVIFNGNGYCEESQERLTKAGLWRIDEGIKAIQRFTVEKNIKMFEELHVFSANECKARQNVFLGQYVGVVEMEAHVMIDMVNQLVLPVVREQVNVPSISKYLPDLILGVEKLTDKLREMHQIPSDGEGLPRKADIAREIRLSHMFELRATCDAVEAVIPANKWPLPTYGQLLFLDQNNQYTYDTVSGSGGWSNTSDAGSEK
jgi:glutamine synthetase